MVGLGLCMNVDIAIFIWINTIITIFGLGGDQVPACNSISLTED